MALLSPTKRADLEFLTVWSDIIEVTYRHYKKNPTPEAKQSLEEFVQTFNDLKHQIDTKDYTKEDEDYWRLEAFFREVELSPPTL